MKDYLIALYFKYQVFEGFMYVVMYFRDVLMFVTHFRDMPFIKIKDSFVKQNLSKTSYYWLKIKWSIETVLHVLGNQNDWNLLNGMETVNKSFSKYFLWCFFLCSINIQGSLSTLFVPWLNYKYLARNMCCPSPKTLCGESVGLDWVSIPGQDVRQNSYQALRT